MGVALRGHGGMEMGVGITLEDGVVLGHSLKHSFIRGEQNSLKSTQKVSTEVCKS